MIHRRLFIVALLIICGLFSVSAAENSATPSDPIIGKWVYHGDDLVTLHPDNTAKSRQGGHGTWRFLNNPEAERKYEITWYGGVYVDSLKLSHDGKKLDGKNKQGRRIVATRIPETAK